MYKVLYRLYGINTVVERRTLEDATKLAKQICGIVWFGQ